MTPIANRRSVRRRRPNGSSARHAMCLKTLFLSDGRRLFYSKDHDAQTGASALSEQIRAAGPAAFVKRPWGSWQEIARNEECSVRILHVNPGEMLSDQRHQQRDELYVVLDPGTVVKLNGTECCPSVDDLVFIPRNTWHRLVSASARKIRVVEVSFGNYDQNDDIERRQDKYNRQLRGPGTGAQ